MAPKKKPTAATWRKLGNAARSSRDTMRLTRQELAELANVSAGSIERLENGVAPTTAKFPRSYLWVTGALGWPDGWADAILSGTESGPPVNTAGTPSRSIKQTAQPKEDRLLDQLRRGDNGRVILQDVPTSDLLKMIVRLTEEVADRDAAIDLDQPAPVARTSRARSMRT